jgi:hypothetical protein
LRAAEAAHLSQLEPAELVAERRRLGEALALNPRPDTAREFGDVTVARQSRPRPTEYAASYAWDQAVEMIADRTPSRADIWTAGWI